MKLPSFNKRQFIAHIKRGPGFGCWRQARIERAWGKKPRRVTAKDIARRILRTTTEHNKQTFIMISMLNKLNLIELFKKLDLCHSFISQWVYARQWAYEALRTRTVFEVATKVLEL